MTKGYVLLVNATAIPAAAIAAIAALAAIAAIAAIAALAAKNKMKAIRARFFLKARYL